MHECMHTYIYACTHVHVSSTYIRTYVCMHGMCVCVRVLTYVCYFVHVTYLAQGDLNYGDLVVE